MTLATDGTAAAVTAIVAGSGAIASTLYNLKAKYFYYTEYYRYRTLANNKLVIMADETKTYCYQDKDHKNYIGLQTYSWSEY